MRSSQIRQFWRIAEQLCQAEVGNFHSASFINQNIFRLDVAVNNPFFMSELKCIADLSNDCEGIFRSDLTSSNRLP